jgi:hypothetical protein
MLWIQASFVDAFMPREPGLVCSVRIPTRSIGELPVGGKAALLPAPFPLVNIVVVLRIHPARNAPLRFPNTKLFPPLSDVAPNNHVRSLPTNPASDIFTLGPGESEYPLALSLDLVPEAASGIIHVRVILQPMNCGIHFL